MSENLTVIGGAGGTHARLEDLIRAGDLLTAAAARLEAIGRTARIAGRAVAGVEVGAEDVCFRERAIDRINWIDQGDGGATGVAQEMVDVAWNLGQTVQLLEDAERISGSIWKPLGRLIDKGVAIASFAVWVPLKIVGSVGGTVADKVEGITPKWLPAHWIAVGGGWVADTVNPDWTPNLTPLVYGDDVQFVLGLFDNAYKNLVLLPNVALSGIGLGLPDDLVTVFAGELALVSLALDGILGDTRGMLVFPVASRQLDPPTGVADLFGRLESLSPGGADGAGRIAIERVDHADGSHAWIVEIPGTQDFTPDGGSNVIDGTSNFLLMSGGQSDLTLGVTWAMEEAGIPADEEVLLIGHSQGGIAAMSLVSWPAFTDRFNVTAVATAGACVGGKKPPPDVSVISLEHTSDTVPALDGVANPDEPNWTTVRRDLGASDDVVDRMADNNFLDRHELESYLRTAALVDDSTDPSIRQWIKDTEAFRAADDRLSTRTVYEVIRGADGLVVSSELPLATTGVPRSG